MAREISAYVAITDRDWFDSLRSVDGLEEVNFWQPSASGTFGALRPGEPLLFKLHSPDNFIVGGGFFAYWTKLPVSLAWDAFGMSNGARSLVEMRTRIERYRRTTPSIREDYEIGCILLEQPFFLAREEWLPVPGWSGSIQRGKRYALTEPPGSILWQDIMLRLKGKPSEVLDQGAEVADAPERYGKPVFMQPRLGQGSFRVVVTDEYRRRCAVTGEKVLPVLEAAHIRPYAEGGEHRLDNGLLLRSDAHTLFDRGYITVKPDYRVEVSKRLKADFDNGEQYYAWRGRIIEVPEKPENQPAKDFLIWHNDNRFIA